MVGDDDRLRAGLDREFSVLDVEDALEDQLARPDAADPVDVLPVQRGVGLRGGPFGQPVQILGAFDVADDVAEAAALAAQHPGDPGGLAGEVEPVRPPTSRRARRGCWSTGPASTHRPGYAGET